MAAGIIAKVFLGKYDFLSDGISIFSTLWIAAGCCLLLISIFGIIVSFGSSTILINGVSCSMIISERSISMGNNFDFRKKLQGMNSRHAPFSLNDKLCNEGGAKRYRDIKVS